ncbi:MAG: TonB-dependent receptor plug domain-containing protein, partial [bacterium]|nr:TonB-dependent receptor plug domain-containing protein [bacterium]
MIKSIQYIIIASYLFIATFSFASSSSITGQVFDAKTGKRLAATNIEIMGTTIGTAADDQGNFIIRDLLPGQYNLKITRIGYKPSQAIVNLKPDESVALKIFLEPTVIEGTRITVTAKADANQAIARETPVSFRKLSIEELANNYTTGDLPELIQNVPGVWTSSAGIGESEITIRGFASNKIRVLVNDVPINNPEDNQVYWSNWAGLSNAARSVEIQRGPGFLLYGANNFGGSLHIQTMGVTATPETNFRVSAGVFNRMGIESGPNAGMFYNPITDAYQKIVNAINYTYSARFNTGTKYNGLLNASFFFEYKIGDSYIVGTDYDGFTLGLDAESVLGSHKLTFNFIVSPQAHNQAFALQDINLLKNLGREYNRKNHIWQENHYVKPFWALKHSWQISAEKVLNNNIFFSFGRGADQSMTNDLFDVKTGKVDFQPCTRGGDAQAFGYHAQYLYNEYNLLTTDFIPARGGYPSFFRGVEVYNAN